MLNNLCDRSLFLFTVIFVAEFMFLLTQIFAKLTCLGRIHSVSTGVEPSKIGNGIVKILVSFRQ